MKIKDIVGCLETAFPPAYQEEYDNSGLQAGDPAKETVKALAALDVTEGVLQEAADRGCDFIISHHPLIFRGLKTLSGNHPVQRMLIRAIKEDIAVYSVHTNLDNSLKGLNAYLGKLLGLSGVTLLKPAENLLSKLVTFCPPAHEEKVRKALCESGAGHIGNYDYCSFNTQGKGTFRASDDANPFVGKKNEIHAEDETRIEVIFPSYLQDSLVSALKKSHPYEEVAYDVYPLKNTNPVSGSGIKGTLEHSLDEKEFLARVRGILETPYIRHSSLTGKKVKSVALCTGSGSFLIPEIVKNELDAFLTADLKYHDFFEPDGRFLLADIGHFESERFSKELICSVLKEKFPNFAVLISETDTNPVHYY